MRLTDHFRLEEFQDVSQRPLTEAEKQKALAHARIMEPMRVELGFPMRPSSYVRVGSHIGAGGHEFGDGCDWEPTDKSRAKVKQMHDWLAARPHLYGESGYERDHVHNTLRGYRGEYGEVWYEYDEGVYTTTAATVPDTGGNSGTIIRAGTAPTSNPRAVGIVAAVVGVGIIYLLSES